MPKKVIVTGIETFATRRLLKQLPAGVKVVPLSARGDEKADKLIHVSTTRVYGASPLNPAYMNEDAGLAESEAAGTIVLRPAPIIGPTIENGVTRFLARRLAPSMPGFDPLIQFLHEDDFAAALLLAIKSTKRGVFNIAGDGVLPLSSVYKLTGARRLPVPLPAPIDLRWACVADTSRAKEALRFAPQVTSRDAVLDFAQTLRLRRLAA